MGLSGSNHYQLVLLPYNAPSLRLTGGPFHIMGLSGSNQFQLILLPNNASFSYLRMAHFTLWVLYIVRAHLFTLNIKTCLTHGRIPFLAMLCIPSLDYKHNPFNNDANQLCLLPHLPMLIICLQPALSTPNCASHNINFYRKLLAFEPSDTIYNND